MRPRAERRAARRKLAANKVYTFKATGDVLTAMAEGAFIRRDGQIVSVSWALQEDGGTIANPVFALIGKIGGGWRVRLARWLLRLK